MLRLTVTRGLLHPPQGVPACQSGHFVTRTPRDLVGTRSLWRRGNLVLRSHRRTRHTTASASVRLAPCESKGTARKGTRKSTTCQTCAHRRHATRPRDLRASPSAANGTLPSVPIHPTSLPSSAASKKLGLPSLTGSAEQALFAYCESMCSEGAGEFLHSEHMRQRPGARSRCAAQWTMPGQAILTARSGAPPTSCTAVASMAAWSALNVA